MATNKPRIPVTLEPELFQQVTNYRIQRGITSQSKAIQQLVRLGLHSLEGEARPVRLTDAEPETRDSQERELLRIARELDPAQKEVLLRILALAGEREETRRTR